MTVGTSDIAKAASQESGLSAVEQIQALVAGDMARVNTLIIEKMQSPVALIPQLAGHLVNSGGKRLRPMLTLASANLLKYSGHHHIELAACVEFIHTATLLHDDVVDESKLRRGQDTANEIWGNQASVLVGDFLFSRAFELMIDTGSLDVLRILSGASNVIAEGEVLQLTTAGNIETTVDTYLDVIGAKTAALFAAACEVAAVVNESDPEVQDRLRTYGDALGVAFQIVDDVLDYSAEQATLGKTVGDDFREGKMTLPVLHALDAATDEERGFWRRTLADGEQTEADLEVALSLLDRHKALKSAMAVADEYGTKAKEALAPFDDTAAKQSMTALVDFCLARGH